MAKGLLVLAIRNGIHENHKKKVGGYFKSMDTLNPGGGIEINFDELSGYAGFNVTPDFIGRYIPYVTRDSNKNKYYFHKEFYESTLNKEKRQIKQHVTLLVILTAILLILLIYNTA